MALRPTAFLPLLPSTGWGLCYLSPAVLLHGLFLPCPQLQFCRTTSCSCFHSGFLTRSFYLGWLSHPLVSPSSFLAICRPARFPQPRRPDIACWLVCFCPWALGFPVSQSTAGPPGCGQRSVPPLPFSDGGGVTQGGQSTCPHLLRVCCVLSLVPAPQR